MSLSTEQIWYAWHEPLRLFIRKRIADEESAEDLLQEAFLRIHSHVGELRDQHKLGSWVYQLTRNLIIDYYRRKQSTVTIEEAEALLPMDEIPEEDIRAQLGPVVVNMLNCLPDVDREALMLTDYQGVSQKELAIRLGLSFSGAKSRVQRAREKMRQMLLDCCHFEFDRLGRVIDYRSSCRTCQSCGGQACGPSCKSSSVSD